jgi:Domain of unknown function (DUF5916)/Carbohydrate family 9 binding domain-like
MKRILIIAGIIFLFSLTTFGQTIVKKQYKATKITVAPEINGILDDEAWKSGDWAGDFTQNQPYSGRPATQRTEFKILFDDNNLYVAVKAYDTSTDSIVNRLTRRDEADGDLVGIILDSFHDLRTGFLFGVSSAGVKYDHMFTSDGQNEDSSWDPNWWVKTSVNKEGWVAEMKIPLSQVRFEKNSADVWGLEIARVLYRKNETSFWQHIPKDAPGMVHLFGELTGLEQIKPRKIFDITPYGVAKAETFQADPLNPFIAKGKSSGINGGVDAKIGVTNNMTMDLTINPDFGQVEADPSEVNLTAYETFFKEKRPFFIEGNNITNFNLGIGDGDVGNDNIFYSRRIGRRPEFNVPLSDTEYADIPTSTRILGAVKLTGKSKNGLSLGFIESVTALERAEIKTYIPSDGTYDKRYENVEPLTNYFVGRVQKDFNNGKTILGGIMTSTNRDLDPSLSDYMHKAAYTGGIDFTQYFKEKNWMINLNAAFSDVTGSKKAIENTQESSARYYQRPDKNYAVLDTNRTSLVGSGGRMEIMKLNGHWNFMSATTWKSPGFELNDIGYLRQADQILSVLWGQYNQFEPKGFYRNYNINSDIYSVWNFGGDNLGKGLEWNGNINLKNFWNLWIGGNVNTSSFSTDILRGGPKMILPGSINERIGFTTDNRKKLMINFYISSSSGFEKSSNNFSPGVDITIKPSNYLVITISPGYSKSFSELQYVTQTTYGNSDRYIFGSIDRRTVNASFRINFNLSPDLTLQYWGQPFIATGKYYNYKYITSPLADKYHNRFQAYTPDQISSDPDNYYIDENRDGNNDYSFGRPDFNVQDFLSNLVLRWEYSPGSTVFIVWSQTRGNYNETGTMDLFNNLGDLFDSGNNKPHNVFLIKFSYRFGLK